MNKLAKSFVALGVVAGAAIGSLWVAQPSIGSDLNKL